MNSPVDPVLLQLVQQNLNSLQDEVKNMSADCEEEKTKVQTALQNCASVLEDLKQRVIRLETGQQNIERQAELTKNRVGDLEDRVTVVEAKHEGNYKIRKNHVQTCKSGQQLKCVKSLFTFFQYFMKQKKNIFHE